MDYGLPLVAFVMALGSLAGALLLAMLRPRPS
jgi:hypothetical protein